MAPTRCPQPRMVERGRETPERGFTLVELVLVIIILGILGSLTSGIILQPFKAFQDQSRRASLVAEADMVLTRMVRELRMAVPNSVRVAGGGRFIEFIPTVDGGRYRALPDTADPSSDALDFTFPDNSFDVLGGLQSGEAAAGDFVVVYNASATAPAANAYIGDNRAVVASLAADAITLAVQKQFPFPSLDAQRFDVVPASGPVSYYCNGGALRRHTGYGFAQPQSTGFTSEGALFANRVTLCQFGYTPGDQMRNGVVTLRLGITEDGESVTLLYQVQVVNAP